MRDIVFQINSTLTAIVKLENQLFGGGILSIFVKKNFAVIGIMLRVNAEQLAMYRDELLHIGVSGIDSSLELDFVDALEASTNKMADIADRLNKKSLGSHSYSMSEYNSDVKQLKVMQEKYMTIGELLNRKYR